MKNNMKTLFAISLFLNVLLVGVIAGHIMRHVSQHVLMEKTANEIATVLPDSNRHKFVEATKSIREQSDKNFKNADNIRLESLVILTAHDFDKQKFIDTLGEIDRNASDFHKKMTLSIADAAEGLTQEERIRLADKLKELQAAMPHPPRN